MDTVAVEIASAMVCDITALRCHGLAADIIQLSNDYLGTPQCRERFSRVLRAREALENRLPMGTLFAERVGRCVTAFTRPRKGCNATTEPAGTYPHQKKSSWAVISTAPVSAEKSGERQ